VLKLQVLFLFSEIKLDTTLKSHILIILIFHYKIACIT